MIWNWYGTPNASGGLSGIQSAVRPVSCGPRFTLYFSAPGFSVGTRATPSAAGAAPRPRPPPRPKAYTPEKSGLPSAVRGMPFFAAAGSPDAAAAGVVPSTVTVIERVTGALFGPRIVTV